MIFTVTPIYALLVAAIYLTLWMRVTMLRAKTGVSIGYSGNIQLLHRIRQHGNCSEWSSFVLILMILAEGSGVPAMFLHISGGLLFVGRLAHPLGLKTDNAAHFLRYLGNGTNLLAALNTMIWLGISIVAS